MVSLRAYKSSIPSLVLLFRGLSNLASGFSHPGPPHAKRHRLAMSTSPEEILETTGMPLGPYPVGVTTVQFDDPSRADRALQTEIWYPAREEARLMTPNLYSDFIGSRGCADPAEAVALADGPSAIGGYRKGITVKELDGTWTNQAVRDARVREGKFPLVAFSHGSGAYRASYVYWTEFLASHGFVVAAPDHPGSARYTVVNGEVVLPGGTQSRQSNMERDRPLDLIAVIDGMERLSKTDSRFAGRVDCRNVAVTGMSFGGFTVAEVLQLGDSRVRAAVLQCPALRQAASTGDVPVLVMLGTEDVVLGRDRNERAREYARCRQGDSYLLEVKRGGHVSFTSCEKYDPDYGNGIAKSQRCPAIEGGTYAPLDIVQQHSMINAYGLAFLNSYLRGDSQAYPDSSQSAYNQSYLQSNHFADSGELLFESFL